MTKLYILIFLTATFLMISCEKDTSKSKSTMDANDWEISKSTIDFDINSRDMFFLNAKSGFVVGYNGDIYKTADSGKIWQRKNSGTTLHLNSVYFLNENVGFVSGGSMGGCLDNDCDKGSILLKTTDGGDTWTKTFFDRYTGIYCLKFIDNLKGVAIIHTPDVPNSRSEFFARTSDGGVNWELIDLDIKTVNDKFLYVDNTILIAGENQVIFKSIDFGINWAIIKTPVKAWNFVGSMYFYNMDIGFINGITDTYKTINGGNTWEKVDVPFTSFSVMHFYNENEGINIVPVSAYEEGDFPTFKGSIIYTTEDSGKSWSKSNLIDTLSLGLTYFPQRNLGYGFNSPAFYTIQKNE